MTEFYLQYTFSYMGRRKEINISIFLELESNPQSYAFIHTLLPCGIIIIILNQYGVSLFIVYIYRL